MQNLTIEGEISNFVAHSSGHAYFSLKDKESKINCVMFSRYFTKVDIKIKNGDKVDCKGDVSIFVRDGKFQLYVKEIEIAGQGALHIKFEKLKKKYKELGYFEDKNKKDIPAYPKKIGIITSSKGAAIKDVISVLNRRTTLANCIIYSASVQGIYSKDEIVKGINYFNDNQNVDLIIITRGGGSIEELWSFNEPEVVESVFYSDIPIISGVGHETDYTLIDFVSDLRAPTPSAAAEIAFKSNDEILKELDHYKIKLNKEITKKIKDNRARLEKLSLSNFLLRKKHDINQKFNLLDNINLKMNQVINEKINKKRTILKELLIKLNYNNPIEVLKKGYTITKDSKNNVITSIENVSVNDTIVTSLSDGGIISKVSRIYGDDDE